MAKKNSTRPWRLSYVWESGIKGVLTYDTEANANDKADEMRAYAELRGAAIEITVAHR